MLCADQGLAVNATACDSAVNSSRLLRDDYVAVANSASSNATLADCAVAGCDLALVYRLPDVVANLVIGW